MSNTYFIILVIFFAKVSFLNLHPIFKPTFLLTISFYGSYSGVNGNKKSHLKLIK